MLFWMLLALVYVCFIIVFAGIFEYLWRARAMPIARVENKVVRDGDPQTILETAHWYIDSLNVEGVNMEYNGPDHDNAYVITVYGNALRDAQRVRR